MPPHTIAFFCPATTRRAVLTVVVSIAVVAGGALTAAPASADSADVSSKAGLDARLRDASAGEPTTIRLGQDLTSDEGAHDVLTTPGGSIVTLDLHGQRLTLQQLILGSGSDLEITDSTSTSTGAAGFLQVGSSGSSSSAVPTGIAIGAGATMSVTGTQVAAYGSDVGRSAGIGSPGGLTAGAGRLVLSDSAIVSGQGGKGGAGIGGAQAAAAIAVSVLDSTLVGRGGLGGAGIGSGRDGTSFGGLTSTSSPSGSSSAGVSGQRSSSIDASGGRGAAGIGGGLHASGGSVHLDGDTDANASTSGAVTGSSGAPSAVGAGQAPAGASATFGALRVGRRAWLWINDPGDPLVVPADGEVVNDGSIRAMGGVTGDGTIDNHGLISAASNSSTISPETDPGALITVSAVTGHNYEVVLHPNGGGAPSRSSVHVFCAFLDVGFLPSATAPRPGWSLIGWNTKADGSGEDFSDQSLEELTGDESQDGSPVRLDLYARFGVAPHFTASTMPVAAVGKAYDQALPVAGEGITGYWVAGYDEDGAVIPGLPAGLGLDAASGRILGTPSEAGTYRFRVVAAGRNPVSDDVSITVAGSPAIVTGALPAGRQGTAYSLALAATGGGTVRWSVSSGSLPPGLSLSSSGVLSGTPSGSGVERFTLQASNEYGKTLRALDLDVEARSMPTSEPSAPTTDPSAPAPAAPTSTPDQGNPPTAPTATGASAPVLAGPQRAEVRFGRPLALSVSASSAAPVTYAMRGSLPSGLTFDSRTGSIGGVPGEAGTFRATVTASNTAGASSVVVTIVVAEPEELIQVGHVGATWTGARPLPLRIAGLRKGEQFRIAVDGRTVRSATVKRSGSVTTSIVLAEVRHDAVHRIEISTNRRITDPATTASTSFRVSSLSARKALRAAPGTGRRAEKIVVQRLAAGEEVLVRSDGVVVSRGHANDRGEYSFARSRAGKGTHRISVTGATATRSARLTVKNPGR